MSDPEPDPEAEPDAESEAEPRAEPRAEGGAEPAVEPGGGVAVAGVRSRSTVRCLGSTGGGVLLLAPWPARSSGLSTSSSAGGGRWGCGCWAAGTCSCCSCCFGGWPSAGAQCAASDVPDAADGSGAPLDGPEGPPDGPPDGVTDEICDCCSWDDCRPVSAPLRLAPPANFMPRPDCGKAKSNQVLEGELRYTEQREREEAHCS